MLKLYSYYRSSAVFRVRIALELKGVAKEVLPVNLLDGEQRAASYRALNPQGLVPAVVDEGVLLNQSLAIIEYLDETHPEPPLLPREPLARARVRSLAHHIAMDIHPLNNLRVLQYLEKDLSLDQIARDRWYQHWIAEGFRGVEAALCKFRGDDPFCFGATPGLADICLVPMVYNARRFHCDLSPYPLILAVAEHCNSLPAFQAAAPEAQPDWPGK